MTDEDRIVQGLAKKDADTIQKFVFHVLKRGIKYWETRTVEAQRASSSLSFHDREKDAAELDYERSFRQWHLLRQTKNHVTAWLDVTRSLPEKKDE